MRSIVILGVVGIAAADCIYDQERFCELAKAGTSRWADDYYLYNYYSCTPEGIEQGCKFWEEAATAAGPGGTPEAKKKFRQMKKLREIQYYELNKLKPTGGVDLVTSTAVASAFALGTLMLQ